RRREPPVVPPSAPGRAPAALPRPVPEEAAPPAPAPDGFGPRDVRVRVDHDALPPSGRAPFGELGPEGPEVPAPGVVGRGRLPYARRVASARVGSGSHGRRGAV